MRKRADATHFLCIPPHLKAARRAQRPQAGRRVRPASPRGGRIKPWSERSGTRTSRLQVLPPRKGAVRVVGGARVEKQCTAEAY